MIGYYNYTVLLTYMSLASTVVGLCFCIDRNPHGALICLMVSGFFDMFDGTVARTRKRTADEIAFGMHIDSLTDLGAFGILPAMVLYALGGTEPWFMAVMIFYALTALIRLAFFDVQEAKNVGSGEKRRYFTGLPVTNAAMIIPGLQLINLLIGLDFRYFYMGSLIAVGIAFITPFKLKKAYMPALLYVAAIGVAIFVLLCIYGGLII